MRLLALILIVALATAAASPATSFGGPRGCRCNCPVPVQGNEVCAKEGRGPEEMFPSKCYLECYNCTHNKEFVVVQKKKCQKRG